MRALVTALSALLAAASAQAQPIVVVRSESRIELRTVRHEDHVVVEGALRDDLGEPLAGRELVVRATPDGPEAPIRHAVTTREDGGFRVRLNLSTGGYRLSAGFSGDGVHERVEVERRLDLDRADVRLRVVVPDGGRLDLDQPEHRVEVFADSTEGPGGLVVHLLDEHDRRLASEVTDAAGRAAFTVQAATLGPPGAGRIKARSGADALRAEAQTEVPVVRFRATALTLRASRTEARPGDEVRFEGALRDSTGPIEGRAVGLFAGQEHLATVLTAADGSFAVGVPLRAQHAGSLEVVARYESDAPGRTGSTSEPVLLEVAAPRPMPWAWLLLPLAVCCVLLAWIARAGPRRPEKSVAPPEERPAGVRISKRRSLRADRADVTGRVLDHRDDEPVPAARVLLTAGGGRERRADAGEDGAFRLDGLEAGDWTLTVSADGYAEAQAQLSLPHRGEWSDMVVRLVSMRARALAPYRPVAEAILPSPRLWGVWTSREVLAQARGTGRGAPPLDDLTDRVEQACYGARPPTGEDVVAIEERAERALRGLREGEPETSADPLQEADSGPR